MTVQMSMKDFMEMLERADIRTVAEKTAKVLEGLANQASAMKSEQGRVCVGIDLEGRFVTSCRYSYNSFITGRVCQVWFDGKHVSVTLKEVRSICLSRGTTGYGKPEKERHILYRWEKDADNFFFRSLTVADCRDFDKAEVRRIVGDKIMHDSIQAGGNCFAFADNSDEMKLFDLVMEECEGLVLPLPLDRIVRHGNHTKTDIVSQRGRIKNLPKTLNKYPLPVGLAVAHMIKVMPESYARLLGKKNSEDLMNIFRGFNGRRSSLLSYLEAGVAKLLYPTIDDHVAETYIRLCLKNKSVLDLSIRKEHTMLMKVLEMSKNEGNGRKLRIAKPFEVLSRIIGNEYELLGTEERLNLESMVQGNCVRTYARAVNEGRCAIFSYVADDRRYTIEVRYDEEEGYTCPQFLGKYNRNSEECRKLAGIFRDVLKKASERKRNNAEGLMHNLDALIDVLSA